VAIFDFTKFFKETTKQAKPKDNDGDKSVLSISEFVKELGIGRDGVIGSYDTEENPDSYGPEDYIAMQDNDGEVRGIIRLLSLPIISTPIRVIPAENDNGERDFIETVLMAPYELGGMTTPFPLIIADMTRAIAEGFRLYEKVARIIPDGPYKNKIGWRKLAPRDAQTIEIKADEHGGFDGAHQEATFGSNSVNVDIPKEKCVLFTFQKERHWLYGESILKTAYYHYDKKHKLYYIAHKKAEIEAIGLKILKVGQTKTAAERAAAEDVVDTIGVNTRITLPPGVELDIERGSGGYDPLPLINHHNQMMARSALTQAVDQVKYAYPYGKGTSSSQYLALAIESIMRQMEATINSYIVTPLIDWNFNSKAYPTIKFEKLNDISKVFLREVFQKIMQAKTKIPDGFVEEVVNETAKELKLEWTADKDNNERDYKREDDEKDDDKNDEQEEENEGDKKDEDKKDNKENDKEEKQKSATPFKSFEEGKRKKSDMLRIKAPKTPKEIKNKLLKIKNNTEQIAGCYELGEKFATLWQKKTQE